jgi:aminopeptidase
MLYDFAPKMAEVIAGYSTRIKEGDYVVISAPTLAEPLLAALYKAILRRGGHTELHLRLPGIRELYMHEASDAQLQFIPPTAEAWMKKADVYMVIDAPHNPKALTGVDPARFAILQQAQRPLTEVMFARMGSGAMRYHLTLWPTHASAQQADMGLRAYREFVYNACGLDQDDPVAYWEQFRDRQLKLTDWLNGKQHAEIKGPGIDLSFDFQDRVWVSCHGTLNFPDGEIYTGPVEDSVNGHVEFSYPSLYMGREVSGVKLTFKDGVVTDASAEKGEDHLLAQLEVDNGARRLGEFAIGTNWGVQQYTGNTLFDEKIGGTIHMALGHSIPESKGVNQSSVHWDIVHGMQDGGEIRIDGELFYQSGKFMID